MANPTQDYVYSWPNVRFRIMGPTPATGELKNVRSISGGGHHSNLKPVYTTGRQPLAQLALGQITYDSITLNVLKADWDGFTNKIGYDNVVKNQHLPFDFIVMNSPEPGQIMPVSVVKYSNCMVESATENYAGQGSSDETSVDIEIIFTRKSGPIGGI
jgi:hypothetical protein